MKSVIYDSKYKKGIWSVIEIECTNCLQYHILVIEIRSTLSNLECPYCLKNNITLNELLKKKLFILSICK